MIHPRHGSGGEGAVCQARSETPLAGWRTGAGPSDVSTRHVHTHTHSHTHTPLFIVFSPPPAAPAAASSDGRAACPSRRQGNTRRACPRGRGGPWERHSLHESLCFQSQNQNRSSVVGSRTPTLPHGVSPRLGGAGAGRWLASGRAGVTQGALWFRDRAPASSCAVLAHEGHNAGRWARFGQERVLQQLGRRGPLCRVPHQQAVQEALQGR